MSEETAKPDGDDDDPVTVQAAERFLNNREWPLVLKLGTPVEFGKNETVTELKFQKGTFGVLKGMSVARVPNADECQKIASLLTGKSLRVIESLDPDDAAEVIGYAVGFFNRCQGAGRKRSAT
jgi:hypothetical protein